MKPVIRHVLFIAGNLQKPGHPNTGLDELYHRLYGELVDGETMLWMKVWDDDFKSVASQINKYRHGRHVEVDIVAYSWGVGHGAVTLARELRRFGLEVNRLFSIDGVYKPWIPLPVRSLFSRWNPLAPKIIVPSNVNTVIYWRQIRTRPQGHELVGELPIQVIVPANADDGIVDGVSHTSIDNAKVIHDYIAERLVD